jgi:hypothetical protein
MNALITTPEATSYRLSRPGVVAVLAIFVIGMLAQFGQPTGSDVSWLIVVAERLFDGQRLYVDVIESNPPMAIFIYMPAVAIERLSGVSAETAQILITMALAAGSLWLAARIMLRAGLQARVEQFVVFGAFALMILPRGAYAEREHIAVMLMLPGFVLAAARKGQASIPVFLAVAAGIATGLGATIKPHFILALLLPALYSAFRARSLRSILGPETWIGAGIVVAFAGFVALAYPAFLSNIVPMEADTYIHDRIPLLALIVDPLFLSLVGVGLAAFILRRRDCGDGLPVVIALAALGFALAYLEQAKGWRYQLYPAMALVAILCGTEILPQLAGFVAARDSRRWLRIGVGFAALAGLVPLVAMHNYTYALSLPFVAEIRALAPRPKIFALSTDLGIGHPLSRAVGGTWVGATCSQLITQSAKFRRDLTDTDASTKSRMERWIAWDRDRIAEALTEGRPDAIVYDPATFDWAELVTARPDIAAMLAGYSKTNQVNGVELLVRRDHLPRVLAAEATR